jgi:hypothetical protein
LQHKVTCLWKEPAAAKCYRTAISLHGHTNRSKEGLYFIVEFASKRPLLRHALATQEKRARQKSRITVDFWKSYWTPPLPPLAAFRLERRQIEQALGLNAMVSLTDHDSIEAPMLLRVLEEARGIPVSVEWSVPFRDTVLHLGIHNLPAHLAESIMAEFAGYTKAPSERDLPELLRALNERPEVLIVLNHPMWDLAGIGKLRHVHTLSAFMAEFGMFIHALELGGLRSWEENQAVLHFAEGWNQPVVAGGDRHGCEPSAVLNLSQAETFPEFVHEVRKERSSHLLFLPQYKEPFTLRILQTLLDVIREYPDDSLGTRHWDQRVFHPDSSGVIRPLSSLWSKPPGFIEMFFSTVRLLEIAPVRKAMQLALAKPEHQMRFVLGNGQEVAP